MSGGVNPCERPYESTCHAKSSSAVAAMVQYCNTVCGVVDDKLGIGSVQLLDGCQGVGSTDSTAST